jgi:hypothetical protein
MTSTDQLTDTMNTILVKMLRDGFAFAGWSTWDALKRRGLITANTAPRVPASVWCRYMLTETGRAAAQAAQEANQAPVNYPPAWSTETVRAGIALQSFSDDLGTLGTPGTWYRVTDGTERGLFTTRNRGDALRRFQRRVRLASRA